MPLKMFHVKHFSSEAAFLQGKTPMSRTFFGEASAPIS